MFCERVFTIKRGRTSTEDVARSGRLNTPNIIKQIPHMVLEDWRLRANDIVEIIGISLGVHMFLIQELGAKILCARWVLLVCTCCTFGSPLQVRPSLNLCAHLHTIDFEGAAAPKTFTFPL